MQGQKQTKWDDSPGLTIDIINAMFREAKDICDHAAREKKIITDKVFELESDWLSFQAAGVPKSDMVYICHGQGIEIINSARIGFKQDLNP